MKVSSKKTIIFELTPHDAYLLQQSLAYCISDTEEEKDNPFGKFSIEAIQLINRELENKI